MSLSEKNLSALEALSFPSAPAGKPRLDQRERHLHRFYEPLIFLNMLVCGQRASEPKTASELEKKGVYKSWQRYLDHLSFFCDSKCGGKTTAAIAVQAPSPGPVYYLAIRKEFATKSLSHLEWILSELVGLNGLSPDQQQRVEAEIVARSIELSSERVKNYAKWLCNTIRQVMEQPPQIDAHLRQDLQSLMPLQNQRHDLCRLASQFQSLSKLNDQCRKSTTSTGKYEWSKIRHCIGRLGSWSRAAKFVVRVAKKNPRIVSNYRVECIGSVLPVEPPTADHKTNLQKLISHLLPKSADANLNYTWETFNFADKFHQMYTERDFSAYPHAEVVLLEHFYINKLRFFENVRYIGCSKPSCYCCMLYFESHRGDFVPRPSHANVWKNWNIPSSVIEKGGKIMPHAKSTLARMAQRVRDDASAQMASRLPRGPVMPDSTTGLSPIPAVSLLSFSGLRLDDPVDFDGTGGIDEFENEESSDDEEWK